MQKLVEVKNIKKYFTIKDKLFKTGQVKAVDDVSFDIIKGETLGLVGESGCGKSTLARMILRLIPPTSGEIFVDGQNIFSCQKNRMKSLRKKMQIIFQDPFASLNPRFSVEEIIAEPMIIHKTTSPQNIKKESEKILDLVGLDKSALKRYPHEFSGGQRQRISIARALSVNPEFIVADEPVSALDVSIQAQIINLLREIQLELNLTYLFISHDLAVVKYMSDRIMVMCAGKIVEEGKAKDIFKNPVHPYTKTLLAAVPRVG